MTRDGRLTRLLAGFVAAPLLGLVASAATAQHVTFPPKPPPESFYVDEAGIIEPAQRQAINETARSLLLATRIPIFVVTIPSLAAHDAGSYTIEQYALELFNSWGVGSLERNYGLLLVVSRGDRRARIELGAAWDPASSAQAQRVMDGLIIPQFKQRRFSEGILAGVRGMDAMARGLPVPHPERGWWMLGITVGFFAAGVVLAVSLIRSGRAGWGWAVLGMLGIVYVLLRIGFSRWADAAGRSDTAFGGGSSEGSGASGSWEEKD